MSNLINDDLATLDLFSGCGGLSLGFAEAGFLLKAHIEKEETALSTLVSNLHGGNLNGVAIEHDIANVENPKEFICNSGVKDVKIILGGPPCQAYSLVGRAKLNSLGSNEKAYLQDARGNLFLQYLRFVKELLPEVIIMENVPESMAYGKRNIPEEMCKQLDLLGYKSRYTVINAASFGVPQYRERMILISYRDDVGKIPEFPKASYCLGSSIKYRQNLSSVAGSVNFEHAVFTPLLDKGRRAVNSYEAIGDLPFISYFPKTVNICEGSNSLLPYGTDAQNEFQKMMRVHGGYTSSYVANNLIRYTKRDFPIFNRMKEDYTYPEAVRIATQLRNEYIKDNNIEIDDDKIRELDKQFIPPYPVDSFQSKWRVLSKDKPSHTVLAHLGVDTYSHIHYDAMQARGISVREAARLQSFPDSFIFPSNMKHAFVEIGNAVPPLLAYNIALQIRSQLGI